MAQAPPPKREPDPARPSAVDVVAFWRRAGPSRWFTHDAAFDAECRRRFLALHEAAASGTLDDWARDPEGALALVLLLDQMPRNMFRGDGRTWATDAAALRIADGAIAAGLDRSIEPELRQFFYLPFMHAENLPAQDRSVAIYETLGDENALTFARHHRNIVARFGRFPHRNAVLGRTTSADEAAFLETDPFRG